MKKGFANDPNFSAIAVTGGPCAGKTTFLAKARALLEDRGLRVAVLSEGATDLITAGLPPWDSWKDPLAFQRFLLEYNLTREERLYQMLCALKTDRPRVLLCDRGILDAMAYISRDEFLAVLEDTGLDVHPLLERYRAVIHLVTAAEGAEEHYTLANNAARTESPELARVLDKKTQTAWFGHQHLHIIDNSGVTFARKMERCLIALARTLHMPEPLEKERKFHVHSFNISLLKDAVPVRITQDYLVSTDGVERRVRARTHDGSESYYYTEKEPTDIVGERVERERQITLREYESLLREKDPALKTIRKTRYTFAYGGRYIEFDLYHEPLNSLVILEVEVEDLSDTLELPPDIEATEVTGNPIFSNASIARGSLDTMALFS